MTEQQHPTLTQIVSVLSAAWIPFSVSYAGKPETDETPDYFTVHVTDSMNNNQLMVLAELGASMIGQKGSFVIIGRIP